jgi:DNA polymerase elongation subunit (family B)
MELALRLRKEDPDTAPRVGDRVYYVVSNGIGKKRERVVTPQEVIKYQLSIDTEHYLEQIKKHVGAILEPIIGQLEFEQ